ncbi:MAG: response regulator [Lachnospiraceae bacterium]|nr:response regulator [Lachnospiraceae bacterium]
MFHFLVGIQIAAILLCVVCFFLMYRQKETKLVKHMLLITICAIIQNAGFLLELNATNATEALNAIRIEYIGGAFVAHFNLLFALEYNKIKISNRLLAIPFLFSLLVIGCIYTYPLNHLFYTSVDFVSTGIYPHVVLGKGSLYLAYAVLVYSEAIGCMVLMIRRLTMTRQKDLRRNAKILFVASFIPVAGHLLGVCDAFSGYDPAPISIAFSAGVLGITVLKNHLFDMVESAHEALFESMDDAIVIVDADLRFEEANASARDNLPFLRNVVNGTLVNDADFCSIVRQGGRKDAAIGDRIYDVHVNPIEGGKVRTGYAVVFFDVTERKARMDRMEELSRQAESANDTKSAFLANVSHEIRTPIHAILGLNEVILRDYKEPVLTGYAKSIQSSASTLLDLINQLLDFAKIESGNMDLVNTVYDVPLMLQEITSVNRYRAEHKGLTFQSHIGREIPGHLYGDEARIRQIIANLLSNAIKFTERGLIDFTADFEKISNVEGNLRITVSDTGAGIKKTDLPKLFDGFVKMDEQKRHFVAGTGLGLNITKSLLDMMEGEISVTSEYGMGSLFRVVIPQQRVDEQIIADESRAGEKWERDFTAPHAHILLVDDSRISLKVTEALLKPTLADLDLATSGSECLDKICQKKYDLIFLDHRMPYMDGVETLERMRNMSHKSGRAPVIALTANVMGEAAQYYMDIGFDGFLAKPATEEQIDKVLKQFLPAYLIEGV